MKLDPTWKKPASAGLKVALLILAGFLFLRKWENQELRSLELDLGAGEFWLWLIAFLGLGLLNLACDARNWQLVQSLVRPIAWREAVVHNLQCYALAFITPLNSGELAGRYWLQKHPAHRRKAVFLTFWMHLPKLLSKVMVAGAVFLWAVPLPYQALGLLILGLLLMAYLTLERWMTQLEGCHLWRWRLGEYLVAGRPWKREKLHLLALNALRFLAFSSQLAVVLMILAPEELSSGVLLSIPAYYLLSAVVPSWAAVDFLIKGTLALYYFRAFTEQTSLLALAGIIVWAVNVALPALGGFLLLKPSEWRHSKEGST